VTVFRCYWLLGIKSAILFIAGFPNKADQAHLQAFFSQFGPIKKFIYGYQGNFAIVQFCERYALTRAVFSDCVVSYMECIVFDYYCYHCFIVF
jgi:hypothetical protein